MYGGSSYGSVSYGGEAVARAFALLIPQGKYAYVLPNENATTVLLTTNQPATVLL